MRRLESDWDTEHTYEVILFGYRALFSWVHDSDLRVKCRQFDVAFYRIATPLKIGGGQ